MSMKTEAASVKMKAKYKNLISADINIIPHSYKYEAHIG